MPVNGVTDCKRIGGLFLSQKAALDEGLDFTLAHLNLGASQAVSPALSIKHLTCGCGCRQSMISHERYQCTIKHNGAKAFDAHAEWASGPLRSSARGMGCLDGARADLAFGAT